MTAAILIPSIAQVDTLPADARRQPGWPERLAAVLDDARRMPYVLGRTDCFWLACMSIRALTFYDLWHRWDGTYSTRRQALRMIHEFAGAGFSEAFSKLFARDPVRWAWAKRGDIVEFFDSKECHLGVVTGAQFVVPHLKAPIHVNLSQARHAWTFE